jgi:anionic cell wall polymer biosynthesis LytR-Cps2A-Psr (LCP) family protein
VIAVLVATGVFVGKKVTSGGGGGTHHPAAQTAVLMQVSGGQGQPALASALLAHQPGTTTGNLELLVPGQLDVPVCGFGDEPFGDVLGQPSGVSNARQTLSQLLDGVTVDGSWVITTKQLAALVDAVHGVTVDVDVEVTSHSAGHTQVLFSPGTQHLTGANAVAFATFVASKSEAASAQLARFSMVLNAVLAALPTSPKSVTSDLGKVGAAAASPGTHALATLLAGLAADSRAKTLLSTDLPTSTLSAGGTPSYRINSTQVDTLAHRNLAASLPASHGPRPTVELLNGVGTPGLVATACPLLASHGLAFAGSDNAGSFSNAKSQVQVGAQSQVALGDRVAKALGLPLSDVDVVGQQQTVADVVAVLGTDYGTRPAA